MIDPDKCNAVYLLHTEGMAVREISRRLNISRNTVRRIIKQKGVVSPSQRKDKIQIDRELLERLYRDCEHWIQRVHEKLLEEEGIQIGYSTLTRMLRELGIGKPPKTRCDRVPDEPGAEMQHDTTVYQVKLAGQKTKVIASLLYLRYSKRRYLKFYRVFNRFAMKCFLHEALMYWGHAAKQGIIDNTNLARLRGTGKKRGDRSGDGRLRQTVRLRIRLSRNRTCQSKGERGMLHLFRIIGRMVHAPGIG